MANNQSVRRHLDAFTRGRIIGKLEEGRSVTSVAAEFGIAHSIISRLWRQFQTTGTAIRGFSSGRPRGTTPADDRYIVLQARRNRRQTAGEIARHTTQATGRLISRFTVARRLHGGGLFARRPVRCVPLTPAHRRRRSLWCREHRNWRDNEWERVLFTDESRFSLNSDFHRILIWRERGSRNHPSNIIERDRNGGRGVLVWGGIMLGSRTDLYIFDADSVNGSRYCNEILLPYVRLFLDTHHRDVSAFSRIALHATFSIKLLFIPLISLLVPNVTLWYEVLHEIFLLYLLAQNWDRQFWLWVMLELSPNEISHMCSIKDKSGDLTGQVSVSRITLVVILLSLEIAPQTRTTGVGPVRLGSRQFVRRRSPGHLLTNAWLSLAPR
ncbi:transposable element Tcb1 transposase [Trichonephila clavipes]|nr:transposable element Tcb1 transposase [Trichonephila clavipes]